MAEGAWLCAAGGLGGVLVAWAGVRLLQAIGRDVLPRMDAVSIDGRALAFALIAVTAVTLVVGAAVAELSSGS